MDNTIPFSLNELKTSADSFANEVMDKIIDYLLAEGGGVGVVVNTFCCIRIKKSRQVKQNIRKIYQEAS